MTEFGSDDFEDLPDILPNDDEEFRLLLNTISERCNAANIPFLEEIDADGDVVGTISLRSGRSQRSVKIYDSDRANEIISIKFESYSFLSGMEAIYSPTLRYVEAAIKPTRMAPQFVFRRLLREKSYRENEQYIIKILSDIHDETTSSLEISMPSPEFSALTGLRSNRFSLKIKNLRSQNHDNVLEELKTLSYSLFFQIDNIVGSTFTLERERRARQSLLRNRGEHTGLVYPVSAYSEESMSLFMYAKSARDMPLLQFLAFYQSIEFYFPRYSQSESRRRASTILKNPSFRIHRDDDIDRLISAIQGSRSNNFGSERNQLRVVINECISEIEMKEYFFETPEREEYFKRNTQKFHKIPIQSRGADLRQDVADRIYDIRCKIVHTKNEHDDIRERSLILPFSDDAERLMNDIDLVEFIARHVLIATSTELL